MTYKEYLQALISDEGLNTITKVYHRVRNIPYGSTGNRNPQLVCELNVGSCSGKHILLRDLLREVGQEAEVITMFTYFNESTPVHDSYSTELKELSSNFRIPDFHHYVRVKRRSNWINLDATWHNATIPFGFTVNHDWDGEGDTKLASIAEQEYPNQEQLIDFKQHLVASLSNEQRNIRARYFELVSDWIAQLSQERK